MQGPPTVLRGGRAARIALAAVAAASTLAIAAPVSSGSGQPSPPAARQALDQAVETFSSTAQPEGGDATLALRDLALAYPRLRGSDRRQAKALLQRPPVGEHGPAENQLGSGWNVPEAASSPDCTAHFCVHWVSVGGDAPSPADHDGRKDGDGVPDYVEKVEKTVEYAYSKENKKLDWRKPKSDGNRGGNSKVDVYLSEIGSVGLFGYANTDPNESSKGNRRYAYLVLDNDYKEFAPLSPLKALQVTVAHEYNHILQFGIDYHQQIWMFEASATWMEEHVYPAVSDWLRYVPAFAGSTGVPLTRPSAGGGLKIYGDAAFLHYLSKGAHLGPDVVRDAWTRSPKVKPRHFAPTAFNSSIRHNHGPSLSREFSHFAAATAEWNAGHKFPDAKRLADVKRAGKLRPGSYKHTRLDHLAFDLYKVDPRNAGTLKLRVRAKRGTHSAIALVGHRGPRKAGPTTTNLAYMPRGGKATVRLKHAQKFDRITAVVSNSDGRPEGRNSLGSRGFRSDHSGFRMKLVSATRRAGVCRCRG